MTNLASELLDLHAAVDDPQLNAESVSYFVDR